jgi:hypothetical protein
MVKCQASYQEDSSRSRKEDWSIIAVDKFIQATRDSGYKGTESAVAELVDNSLQAGARRVTIEVAVADEQGDHPLRVPVLDDGCGMDRATLRQALRFGGSSRFNDRAGMDRYGMGLPDSSLSQARRVEVFSWHRAGSILYCYLDMESPMVQKLIAKRVHGLILAILKDRFGPVRRNVVKLLEDILDEKKLTALTVFAAKCSDLDAFREALQA